LTQIAQGAAIDQQRLFRVRQHVDESRRDDLAVHIDLGAAVTGRMPADIGDSITVDCYIAEVGRFARAIVYETIANDQVVSSAGGVYRGRGQRGDCETHDRNGARNAQGQLTRLHGLSSGRISRFSLTKSPGEPRPAGGQVPRSAPRHGGCCERALTTGSANVRLISGGLGSKLGLSTAQQRGHSNEF
jgi:hypothetical protein